MVSIVRSIGGYKLPFPIPETQSAFHPRAQRNAFRRRDARLQSRSFYPISIAEIQPKLQPAFLRFSAIIPRNPFHAPHSASFAFWSAIKKCLIEQFRVVRSPAVGKIPGMTPDFDRAGIKLNPRSDGIAPFVSHDERQERYMAYVISELNLERQKLLAKVLAPVTDRLLSVLQLPSGARGLESGCGMGETTRQLAGTLDKPNEIVGLELNPDLVETAKKLSSGEQDDVSFEQGDASALEFADNSFDFVFARYLLMHLAEPEAVLKEMLRVCKSGGAVAVQEPDFSFQRAIRTVGPMNAFLIVPQAFP